jgi:hypothetical protein
LPAGTRSHRFSPSEPELACELMRYDPMLTPFSYLGWGTGAMAGGVASSFLQIDPTSCSTNEVREVMLEVECANANWI